MTTGAPTGHAGQDCPAWAAVAGLAREVEGLRRRVDELTDLPGRVAEVADLVAQLAEHAAAAGRAGRGPRREAGSTVSWLGCPTGPDKSGDAEAVLGRLVGWVARVYLRYADAGLPECWLWHPEVVEELLWLYRAWVASYSDRAPPTAVGDWHDRQRPGVVARIRKYANTCALKTHQAGGEHAVPAPTVAMAEVVPTIAAWWTTGRGQPGPAPTDEQVTAAYAKWRRPRGTL